MKEIYNLKETAEYLGISYVTIKRLVKSARLPAFKIGHQWRIRFDDLQKFIAQKVRYYGLLGVKPLFFYPTVLIRYKDDPKYYLKDEPFYGKFGIKEEWYKKFGGIDERFIKLAEVPYQKIYLEKGQVVICMDAEVYQKYIVQ